MNREEKPPEQASPSIAFDPQSVPRPLRPFMDDQGRIEQWPVKQKTQRLACAYLASKLEPGKSYNEREINDLLILWHTFGDWALLRRLLFDWKYVDRESDGSRYWLRPEGPPPPGSFDPATASPA